MELRVGEAIHRETFHDRWEARLHPRDRAGRWRESVIADVRRLQVAHSKVRLRIAGGEQGLETRDQVLERARQHAEDELRAQGLHLTPDGEVVKIPGDASLDRSSYVPASGRSAARPEVPNVTDTPQQARALKTNRAAQRARELYPAGTRVVARGKDGPGPMGGTVERHVPSTNAQGGHLTVRWDNGHVGRHGPISVMHEPTSGEASPDRTTGLPSTRTPPRFSFKRVPGGGREVRVVRASDGVDIGRMEPIRGGYMLRDNEGANVQDAYVSRDTAAGILSNLFDQRGEASPDRGKATYHAFGKLRTSATPYSHASQDSHGVVRFHTTRDAAARHGRVAEVTVATPEQIAAHRSEVAAQAERERQREEDFRRRFSALPTTNEPTALTRVEAVGLGDLPERAMRSAMADAVAEKAGVSPEAGAEHVDLLRARGHREELLSRIAEQEDRMRTRGPRVVEVPHGRSLLSDEELDAVGRRLRSSDSVPRTHPEAHLAPFMANAERRGVPPVDAFAAYAHMAERTPDEMVPITQAVNARLARHDHEVLAFLRADLAQAEARVAHHTEKRDALLGGPAEVAPSVAPTPTPTAAPEGRIPGAGAVVNGVAGRWAPIMGKQTHIPHHAEWSAPGSDGSTLTSPAGTTKVFRDGALVSEPGKKALHRDVSRGAAPAAPAPTAPAVPYGDLPLSERGPTFDGSHAVFGTWRDPSGKEVSGVSVDDWTRLFPHDTGVVEGNPADVQTQLERLGYEWQPSSERPATADETSFFSMVPDPSFGGNSQDETHWITHDALAHVGEYAPRVGALSGNPLGAYRDHQLADAATYNEEVAAALQANGEAERHYEDNVKAATALRAEIAHRAATGTSVRPRAEVDAELARRDAAQATGGMPHRVATTHIDRGGAVTAFSENTRGRGHGLSTHLGTVQRVGRQWKHSRGDATFPTQDKAGSDLLRIANEQGPPRREANAGDPPVVASTDTAPVDPLAARRERAAELAAERHTRQQATALPEPTEPTAPGSLAGKDLTRVHPKAIDSELARIWDERSRYEARVASIQAAYERDNARRTRYGGQPQEMDARAVESLTSAREKMAELDAESAPMEAEFSRRGGWARYFIVTNGNGHVHSSTRCATCLPTTEFAWLPDLAARSEHDMVAEYGEGACSVCFPSAPSMYQGMRDAGQLSTRERATQAERDARRALKAEREAAKAAKAIANPDGTPLRVWNHGEIRTLVTARNELVNTASNVAEAERARAALAADPNAPSTGYAHHYDEFVGDLERIVAAIAHKTGEDPDTLRAAAVEKAARRFQQRGY